MESKSFTNQNQTRQRDHSSLRRTDTLSGEIILSNLFLDLITKTRLFKYIENFTTKKGKFSDKKF